ncbi:TonB-dependent receptor domain-containing protein [Shewanella intestini]|uniref:TonB-dependent receptor n=1 Tax=Shewanella intestini TaxID=2017544 RepID=A0ABS5I1B1_9GAMM|nr:MULTISPECIES: TonB-dependent receptor [Shewanella]MBR9727812.1 TonB-dependent receptor [Shewanella intestini]MRG36195.1 TonB-dependent receptor [Shewanella sp. XMDDZSB0408]
MKLTLSCVALAVASTMNPVMAAQAATQSNNNTADQNNIERIVVTASPFVRSSMESTTPVSVMTEDQLKLNIEPTLGDTLEKLPGVQASHFGAGASRPIIRGMDGPRVVVLENGLSVGDASTVSADHAVTSEAGTAQQVEILRGPGSLLYGNAAIGGVVNVVNNRVHEQSVDELSGNFGSHYVSGSDGRTVNGELNGGNGAFNWHVDGTHRRTGDYDIPGNAVKGLSHTNGSVENSQVTLDDFAGSVGYTGDDSFVSVSGSRTKSNYGIPSKGVIGDPAITIDLEKQAWQFHAGKANPFAGVSKIRLDVGYTDYQHGEQEDGDADTFFFNKQTEARLSVNNTAWAGWEGVVGLHAIHRDFSVQGEEALTPNSITDTLAAFIVQEHQFGDFRVQLGGRVEHYDLDPESMSLEEQGPAYQPEAVTDNNVTLSAGTVWDFTEGYNLGVSLERAERSATAEELYSYGEHDATQSFELGALFDINNGVVTPKTEATEKEIANNLDITLRKLDGAWTGSLSAAYNRVNNFFYEKDTGLSAADIGGDDADLPVYQFTQGDAELYSLEAQANIAFNDTWSLDLLSDFTRGKLVDGGNIPRIAPLRAGTTLNFDQQDWHAELGVMGYAKQSKTAENETETAGYALVHTAVTYHLTTDAGDLMLYVKGNNLLDQDARPHTSLLKDYSPLMGRSVMVGVNYDF